MKCTNCGSVSEIDVAFCPECGWKMKAAATAPPVQNQAAAVPPAPLPYPQPYASRGTFPEKAPTVKTVHLGEILFVISGILLLAVGFDNLGVSVRGLPVQFLLLGILAIAGGLYQLATVVMPSMLQSMEKATGIVTTIIALVFLVWGMAAVFGPSVGVNGGFLVAAGLISLLAIMLREGMIR